jgi:hypothetical protein
LAHSAPSILIVSDGNEVSLADRPAHERFAALAAAVPSEQLIPRLVTQSLSGGNAFLRRGAGTSAMKV